MLSCGKACNAGSAIPDGIKRRRRLFCQSAVCAVQRGLGIVNHSIRFITMCAYYTILSTLRFSAVLCERKSGCTASDDIEYFVMKLSGVLLAALGFVLTCAIYISLSENIATEYGTIVMITIATYTFYKVTMTIIRAVKQRRNPSPLLAVICICRCGRVCPHVRAVDICLLWRSRYLESAYDEHADRGCRMPVRPDTRNCYGNKWAEKRKVIFNMSKSKMVKANEKIAEKVTESFGKIEKIVVGGYTKIEDAFVDRYLTRDGETVE